MLQWQKEYGRANELPSALATLLLFAVVALVVLALAGGPDAAAQVDQGKPPTFCEEHAGRPGWASVCEP